VLQKRTTVHHFSRRIPPGLLAERRFRLFQDRPALVPPRDFDFTSSGRRHQPGTCTSCSSKRHPVSPKPFLSFHFHRLGSEHLLLKKKAKSVLGVCSAWPYVPLAASELVWRRPTAPRHERSITGTGSSVARRPSITHRFLCGLGKPIPFLPHTR
jgi:hypothetical protein